MRLLLSLKQRQLLNDSKDIQPVADKLPHISDRRDGVNRVTKEVDDIFQLLAWLDSQNLLINLPKDVADGPDRMPSARLYEGDLSVLMVMPGKLEGRLSNHESTVAAILRDLHELSSLVKRPRLTGASGHPVSLEVWSSPSGADGNVN